MKDSQPHLIMKSGQQTDGKRSRGFLRDKFQSLLPEPEGTQFGKLTLVSREFKRTGTSIRMLLECPVCKKQRWMLRGEAIKGLTSCKGACFRPRKIPRWLTSRIAQMKQRCENPSDARYADYGGRGIQFRFSTVLEAGLWIQENLGLDRKKELDRIDNDGNYEAGNLRWSTRRQNMAHTRKRAHQPSLHKIRAEFPDVKYADSTLSRMLCNGMTPEEIRHRFHNLPSTKPKGKYGTFSTADPFIASLAKAC
jgi:hypothetical protein